ncbi:MAG: class II fructose-bisphosphate aldolase [Planctomycetaceae bacterium]|nr:class II fructose-bisphosphate aldolase [Planctomycetaceae bacterium]
MTVAPMQLLLQDAFQHRYGVAAFNIVNDLTMQSVLEPAAEAHSPVIVQVSVKTVKQWGVELIQGMFARLAATFSTPAALHLDHCPDAKLIERCVVAGWNSVLFDASNLTYEDNLRQTIEVVKLAHQHGVAVEGELESVLGVEDGIGSDEPSAVVPLDLAVNFIRQTKIDCFAPAIGTAHGVYKAAPEINFDRVAEIVAAEPLPIVLHGGTGLSDDVFRRLIALGAVKVNISTHLKMVYTNSLRNYLNQYPEQHDPPKLHEAVKSDIKSMVKHYLHLFGSAGRAK